MRPKSITFSGNQFIRTPIPERFWAKVEKRGDDECWPWLCLKDKDGYGRFRLPSRFIRAHRMSWLLIYGSIPQGLCILHECDNPSCTNPNHLWLGTNQENTYDRHRKGRSAIGEKNGGGGKLSNADVLEIRRLRSTGKFKNVVLAKMFGVSNTMIGLIVNRRNWTHI